MKQWQNGLTTLGFFAVLGILLTLFFIKTIFVVIGGGLTPFNMILTLFFFPIH